MSYTILVVEDDASLAEGLKKTLESEGFHAEVAGDGHEALAWLADRTPDLIVADIMMPNLDGYQLYLRLQQHPEWVRIPFIFLSAKGETADIHFAKELGVDDYIAKPFEPDDLIVAVRGRLRRFEQLRAGTEPLPPEPTQTQYEVGKMLIDLDRRRVTIEEQEIELTPMEFEIVRRLVQANGKALSYHELLGDAEEHSIGHEEAVQRVRTYIYRLRGKLAALGEDEDLIVTVHGHGYRLASE